MKLPAFDPYVVLGLPSDATAEQIRAAHRRLAKDWHPDRNPAPDAAARFARVAEAYEWLGDADRRRGYDEHRRRLREAHDRQQAEHARREQEQRAAAERAEAARREEEDRRRREAVAGSTRAEASSRQASRAAVPRRQSAVDPAPDAYEIRDSHDYVARQQTMQGSLLDAAVEDAQDDDAVGEPIVDDGPKPVRESAQAVAFGVAAIVALLVGIGSGVAAFVASASAAADAVDGAWWFSLEFYGRLLLAGFGTLLVAALSAAFAFFVTFAIGYLTAGGLTAIVVLAHGPHGSERPEDDDATLAARLEVRRVTRLCVRHGAGLAGCIATAGIAAWLAMRVAPGLSPTARDELQLVCAAFAIGSGLVAVAACVQLPLRVLRDEDESGVAQATNGRRRHENRPRRQVDATSTLQRDPHSVGEWIRTGKVPGPDPSRPVRRQPRPSVSVAPTRA